MKYTALWIRIYLHLPQGKKKNRYEFTNKRNTSGKSKECKEVHYKKKDRKWKQSNKSLKKLRFPVTGIWLCQSPLCDTIEYCLDFSFSSAFFFCVVVVIYRERVGVGFVFFVVWPRSIMIKKEKKISMNYFFYFVLHSFHFWKEQKHILLRYLLQTLLGHLKYYQFRPSQVCSWIIPIPFVFHLLLLRLNLSQKCFVFEPISNRMLPRSQRSSSLKSTRIYSTYTISVIIRTWNHEKNWKHLNNFFS